MKSNKIHQITFVAILITTSCKFVPQVICLQVGGLEVETVDETNRQIDFRDPYSFDDFYFRLEFEMDFTICQEENRVLPREHYTEFNSDIKSLSITADIDYNSDYPAGTNLVGLFDALTTQKRCFNEFSDLERCKVGLRSPYNLDLLNRYIERQEEQEKGTFSIDEANFFYFLFQLNQPPSQEVDIALTFSWTNDVGEVFTQVLNPITIHP